MLLRLILLVLACAATTHAQLSAGWTSQGVGSPGSGGSAAVSGGTWTVSGGGADIWGTADQFQFVSRTLRGDGSVIARVGVVGNTSGWAKSGVMIRGDATAAAAYTDVVVTPSNSVVFQWRAAAGASAQTIAAGGIVAAPVWVRVTRSGDSVSGSFSYDGANWVQVGERQTVALGASALAGLAVSGEQCGAFDFDFYERRRGAGGMDGCGCRCAVVGGIRDFRRRDADGRRERRLSTARR